MPIDVIKLDKRLQMCANMIRPNSKIADIGTDHAYLAIFLAQNRKIKHVIAADLREGPILNAKKNIEKFGLSNIIETRLCDGLQGIYPEEIDDIIIAGMGGETIAKIIKEAEFLKDKNKRLILQPMTFEPFLRTFLNEEGFKIIKERAVRCSGKIYSVMCAEFCGAIENASNIFPFIGKLDENLDSNAIIYITNEIEKLKKILKGLKCEKKIEKATQIDVIIKEMQSLIEK